MYPSLGSEVYGCVRSEGVGTMVLKCQEKMEAMEARCSEGSPEDCWVATGSG